MRKLNMLFMIGALALVTGCATNTDIAKLQGEIDVITTNQKTLSTGLVDTNRALSTVSSKVDNAVKAAERSEQLCKDINTKLDRMFRKSQLK
jgi:murein lipoprotein